MIVISLLAALLMPPAHAGRRNSAPDVVEDALAFALTDRSKAIALLEEALAGRLSSDDMPIVALHAAEQHRLAGQLMAAAPLFKQARQNSEDETKTAAALGLALITSDNQQRADPLLWEISEKEVLDSQNADRFLWMTVAATQQNDASSVRDYSKRSLNYARADPSQRTRVEDALTQLASSGSAEMPTQGTAYERAVAALEKGDGPRAAQLARKAETQAEEGSFERLRASYLVKRAEANRPVDPNTIAVLIPLSDKYTNVGSQVKEAFEFGFNKAGGNRKLLFIDTGATNEGAVAALERAVLQEGAVAVVGPLLSDATDSVVLAAAALEVPLISISQASEKNDHSWIFQGVPSIGDQVHALLDHVLLKESMNTFAIFAPDSGYGHRAADAFRNEAVARGAEVTSEVFYDPEANALMEYASKLGKKNYAERQSELNRLRDEAQAAGKSREDVVLPPALNFDAIFVPDNANKVPIALAALAFEEFAIGDFRPRGARAVPMLGLSSWNNKKLVTAGGEYVRQSLFPTPFYLPRADAFEGAFKAATGRTPSALDAVTADAGQLVGAACQAGAQDRPGMRDALAAVTTSGTATGTTGFSADDRRTKAQMQILTITRSGLHPVGAPPPPPPEEDEP